MAKRNADDAQTHLVPPGASAIHDAGQGSLPLSRLPAEPHVSLEVEHLPVQKLRLELMELGKHLVDALQSGAPREMVEKLASQYTCGYATIQLRLRQNIPVAQNPRLTAREAKVIALVRAGHDTKSIAAEMRISPLTVKTHLRNARAKTA